VEGGKSISIIIPALDEEERIEETVQSLINGGRSGLEVIVVDGGSTDRTREVARGISGIEVVETGRANRGVQMNAGAAIARGDILVFLHADVRLPAGAIPAVRSALRDESVAGGCFLLRFPEGAGRSLRLVAAGINLRTRLFTTATGDQTIFVSRRVFNELGGFEPLPLMEDIEFFHRLRRGRRVAILREKVEISPRRWLRHGVWRTVFLMYALRFGYWLGFSPARLKHYFLDIR